MAYCGIAAPHRGCEVRHVAALTALPLLRGDPFDRILVAQAMTEGMRLITADARVSDYGGLVLKIRTGLLPEHHCPGLPSVSILARSHRDAERH